MLKNQGNQRHSSLVRFEYMLKTNSVYFFDSVDFEEIITHYVDLGKYNLAKKAINLALEQHPFSVSLKLFYTELLIVQDNLKQAELLLKQMCAIEPTNEEIFIQIGIIYSKTYKHKKAIEVLKRALDFADDKEEIFEMIALEYLDLNDFNKACRYFRECLDFNRDDSSILCNVVYCYDMEDKYIECKDFLLKFIDKEPYNEVAWYNLGRQYTMLDNLEEAIRAFDYAILIDEFFIVAYLERAKVLEQLSLYKKAIENYLIVIELDSPTSFVYNRLGVCYEHIKDYNRAILYYKKAAKEDPLSDNIWSALTDLSYRLEQYNRAKFYINKAIEIDELNSIYWRKYAEIHLKLNMYKESTIALFNCIKLQDNDQHVYRALTDILHYLGEYKQALSIAEKGWQLHKNKTEFLYRLSGLHFLLNNKKVGLEYLQQALYKDSSKLFVFEELYPEFYNIEEVRVSIEKNVNSRK